MRRNLGHRAAEQDARDHLVLRQAGRGGEGDLRIVRALPVDVDADLDILDRRWSRRGRCCGLGGRWPAKAIWPRSSRKRRPARLRVAADQLELADDRRASRSCPGRAGRADHSDSRPMPRDDRRGCRREAGGRAPRCSARPAVGLLARSAAGIGSPRRRTPASCAHLGRRLADELVADLAQLPARRRSRAPLRVVDDRERAGRGRADIVAARELGILEAAAAGRSGSLRPRRGRSCRCPAPCPAPARPLNCSISSVEPSKRPCSGEVGDPRAVLLVLVGQVGGADEAGELRVLHPAARNRRAIAIGRRSRCGRAGWRRTSARRPGRYSGCRRRAARRAAASSRIPRLRAERLQPSPAPGR